MILRSPVFLLLPLLLAGCETPPFTSDSAPGDGAEELLRGYPTKQALFQFVNSMPTRCFRSSATTELCEWTVPAWHAAWQPMARAIGTEQAVNLICELPLSGEPRSPDSCSIHPRRSNRYSWESAPPNRSVYARIVEINRITAAGWMAEADTLTALSRLMGAVPNHCYLREPGTEQSCVWRTTRNTFGHGTLAVWTYISKRMKILLSCHLPIDGSSRAPGSCVAELGE